MDDLISRQAAIEAIDFGAELLRRILDDIDFVGAEREKYEWGLGLIESYISDMKELPSAQPDNKVNLCDSCKHTYPVCPSRSTDVICGNGTGNDNICACSKYEPHAQPEQKWIPFKLRPLTDEEKEEHPEWEYILDCKLPEDGQRILMNVKYKGHEQVQLGEYYCDNEGSYLDGGYEIGTEVVAWMPLPEPYKEGK